MRVGRRSAVSGPAATDSERGATLTLVTLALTAIVGVAALGIETGRVWNERRALVTATDAAANAASGAFGRLEDGCAEAYAYLDTNWPDHANPTCRFTVAPHWRGGVVEVSAIGTVDYGFGRVLGLESGTVTSATAVAWGRQLYRELRPFAFCSAANPTLDRWLEAQAAISRGEDPVWGEGDGTAEVPDEISLRFSLASAESVPACTANGRSPGNWGTIDFDGGNNSLSDLATWVEDGYNGDVITSQATVSCLVDPAGCLPGGPGALSRSLHQELDSLVGTGPVPFLIYDNAEGQGSTMWFRITAIAPAEVLDFRVTGQQHSRYIEVRFTTGVVEDNWDSDISRSCGTSLADCAGFEP